MKNLHTVLIVLCAALATTSIWLALVLHRQDRFVSTNGASPFIMFDRKTAQACWSGAETDPFAAYGGHADPLTTGLKGWQQAAQDNGVAVSTANPPKIPFCKDLK